MENEAPTAEELVPDIEKRKNSIKNFFIGWIKDDYDRYLILVLITAFIIRVMVYMQTKYQAVWWDAADYLASAKRWGLGLDIIDMWYYRRGLLWPLIESLFFRIGLGELSIRFLVVLLSVGIVFVTYQLISMMFNKKLGLLTSIGITFSWVFLFFSGRPLTNLPATFFFLLAIYFFWKAYMINKGKKYFILFGLFYALACLVRMQYLMFSFIFLAMGIVKQKWRFIFNKWLWLSILIFAIIFIPQMVMHNSHFGNPITDLVQYYIGIEGLSETGEIGGVAESKLSDLKNYFTNLPYILDGNQAGYSNLLVISPLYILFIIGFFLFFIDLFLGFDKIFKSYEMQKRFFIFIIITFGLAFLGWIASHLEQRYAMPIIPFLFFIAIYPFIFLDSFLRNKFKMKQRTIMIISIIILIIALVPNYNFGFDLIDSKKASYQEVKLAGEWIKANSEPSDIIISHSHPQITYYSERSNYPSGLNYRRDIPVGTREEFIEFIISDRPKYLILSVFERHTEWIYPFPNEFPELLTPVKLYGSQEKPVLVIYRFDYSNEALSKLRLNIGTTEEITESKLILQNNTHAKIETKDTQ
jgi:4-amino-4-deoxy-L-arabinose transferase-like glycosyltransferase